MHQGVYTAIGCFGTNLPKIQFMNVHSRSIDTRTRSVSPENALHNLDFPLLVDGISLSTTTPQTPSGSSEL